MHIRVLGPIEVTRDGADVDLGTRKQRALVAALALHEGRAVPADTLVDLLWGDEPPPSVDGTLHAYVSGVRRALEPDRPPRAPSTVLVTTDGGYALRTPAGGIDAQAFAARVTSVHGRLSAGRDPDGLVSVPEQLAVDDLLALDGQLTATLDTWRGTPYAELGQAPAAVAERTRLAELRLLALEDRALVRLVLGQHATVVGDLERLTSEHPWRERLEVLRVTALAAAGRQSEALAALRAVRRRLSDELGIDPGPALQRLETAVLRQDRVLATRPPAPAAARVQPPAAASPPPRAAPLVGRGDELRALVALLDRAAAGQTQLAVLVGEAGIGKSTLAAAVAEHARSGGFGVAVGRCSEDEGAPPLWPWRSVFSSLSDQQLLDPADEQAALELVLGTGHAAAGTSRGTLDEAGAAQFRAWDTLTQHLEQAAGRRPLLVVLDDLHWSDGSSARLLRHVVDRVERARLLVLATRRRLPAPTGPLAAAAAALSRRQAVRLELRGLDCAATAELVAATTGSPPAPGHAEALRARTDGNPFFLGELLRWTGETDVAGHVPAGVTEVVQRRFEQLPTATQEVLRTAAVVGRSFELSLLAAACAGDEDSVLDLLEPAMAAGVVEDDDAVDRFRFSHALVRDAVYSGVGPSRRARRHAAVARCMEARAGSASRAEQRSETAWHWLSAGPAHAGRAWRAALAAAHGATAVHAHEDAAALLAAALSAAAGDPDVQPVERYDLLMAQAQACRCVGDDDAVREALGGAIAEARRLGDVQRLAAAAITTTQGLLWTRARGVFDHDAVAILQDVLRQLPPEDSELRCRALLVLAVERYYVEGPRQQRALVDEGLATARRLGDAALRAWACLTAAVALWRPGGSAERASLAEEALAAAEQAQDESAVVHARTLRAIAAMENGHVDVLLSEIERARGQAEHLRLAFPVVVLDLLHIPWLAMQGRFEQAEAAMDRTLDLVSRTSLEPKGDLGLGAVLPVRLWQGRAGELLGPVKAALRDAEPSRLTLLRFLLVRTGRLDEAQELYERAGLPLDGNDWETPWTLAVGAETALALGLRDEGAAAYARMAPYAGTVTAAGSGMALGPTDAFLALAAAAAGDRSTAGRHADDAAALCAAWRLPLVAAWLAEHRRHSGF